MCHLKSLIFDCISFTECLITTLSTADSEAPASNRTFVTSVYPFSTAQCLIWFSDFRREDLNVIFYQNMSNLHNR